jgi:hypothetical protein
MDRRRFVLTSLASGVLAAPLASSANPTNAGAR